MSLVLSLPAQLRRVGLCLAGRIKLKRDQLGWSPVHQLTFSTPFGHPGRGFFFGDYVSCKLASKCPALQEGILIGLRGGSLDGEP